MKAEKRKVSLQDIADELNISRYSVSLALNNKQGVSEELRRKVFETAQEMGYEKLDLKYQRNDIPRKLNIIVLIPEYIRKDTFFYSNIYWAIESQIKAKGHTAILTSVSKEMEEDLQLPSYFSEMKIAGVLVVGVLSEDYIRMLQDLKMPLVSVDQYYDSINIDSVGTANEEGAYQMTEYLIENGHTDIGFVGSIDATSSIYGRWCGYVKAMRVHGLRVPEDHCILEMSPKESLLTWQGELEGYVERMVSLPTVFFCAGDLTAINMVNVLRKQGIDVPEQVSVAGFDNQELSAMCRPALTTYDVKRTYMGRLAVDHILGMIESPRPHTMKMTIPGNVVERESVKRLK